MTDHNSTTPVSPAATDAPVIHAANLKPMDSGSSYRHRHVKYGLNLAITLVMGAAIATSLYYMAVRMDLRAIDLTAGGMASLSPRSRQVIESLDGPVRMTAVFAFAENSDRQEDLTQQRRADQIRRLLTLYEQANPGKVTIATINPRNEQARFDELSKRLTARVIDEGKPYRELLQRYQTWLDAAVKALQIEAGILDNIVRNEGQQLARADNLTQTQFALAVLLGTARNELNDIKRIQEQIEKGTYFEFSAIGQMIRDGLQLGTQLSGLQSAYLSTLTPIPGLSAAARGELANVDVRLKPVIDAVPPTHDVDNLPPLRSEDALRRLTTGAVVIEQGDNVTAVGAGELWVPSGREGPEVEPDFAGEAEVTSALVRATAGPDRPTIVFARFGGGPLVEPDASQVLQRGVEPDHTVLRQRLATEGYNVLQWNLHETTEPPAILSKNPMVAYVIMQDSPVLQDPMRQGMPTPTFGAEHLDAVRKAVGPAGRFLMISGFNAVAGPMGAPMIIRSGYAPMITELLGATVQDQGLVLNGLISSSGATRGKIVLGNNSVNLTEFVFPNDTHPIVAGLYGRTLVMPYAAWMTVEPRANVAYTPLITTPDNERVWGEMTPQQLFEQVNRNPDQPVAASPDDARGPLTLAGSFVFSPAASAGSDAGDASDANKASDAKGKAVVVTCVTLGMDRIAKSSELRQIGDRLIAVPQFPGNIEFLVSAVNWLTDSPTSAIPPASSQVARIKMTPSTAEAWRYIALIGWPAVVMLGAVVVWFVRRQ